MFPDLTSEPLERLASSFIKDGQTIINIERMNGRKGSMDYQFVC